MLQIPEFRTIRYDDGRWTCVGLSVCVVRGDEVSQPQLAATRTARRDRLLSFIEKHRLHQGRVFLLLRHFFIVQTSNSSDSSCS